MVWGSVPRFGIVRTGYCASRVNVGGVRTFLALLGPLLNVELIRCLEQTARKHQYDIFTTL